MQVSVFNQFVFMDNLTVHNQLDQYFGTHHLASKYIRVNIFNALIFTKSKHSMSKFLGIEVSETRVATGDSDVVKRF